jgi:hypothetical protein
MDILECLMFNLQTIASIPKGRRISTAKEFIVIDEDSALQPWRRWRAGDSRDKGVLAVCKEVRTIIKLSEFISESKYLFIEADNDAPDENSTEERDYRLNSLKKICNGLSDAGIGIDNLCETYICDANVIAHLKPLVSEMANHVAKLTKLLNDLGEYIDTRKRYI